MKQKTLLELICRTLLLTLYVLLTVLLLFSFNLELFIKIYFIINLILINGMISAIIKYYLLNKKCDDKNNQLENTCFLNDNIIEKQKLITEAFLLLPDFKRVDVFYYYNKDKEISITIYPELLYYANKYNVVICLRIGFLNIEKFDYNSIKYFKETYLDKLPFKLFKDEDALFNHFTYPKEEDNCVEVMCYLNPLEPLGYWENHIIY